MGKRVCAAALAMLLLCAGAGAEGFTFEQALSLYSGVIGTVHFALPGAPQVVHDEDYPGRWTGSTQLFGNAPGGEEYQFRTGDIGEWVEGYKASGPSLTPLQARANALIGFAAFFILHYGGEPDNIRADGDKAVLTVTFEYSYPDTPGVLYRCKAVLEGTTAVCLMGEDCAELLEAMGRLRPLTPQEMAALAPSPETVTLGALTADFPGKVFSFQSEGSSYAACFTRDFTWCAVQQLDASVALTQGEDELKASLAALAGRVMLPPVAAQGVEGAVLGFPAPDTALLSFSTVTTEPLGPEYGQKWLCRLYVGARGVWYAWAADTGTGRAFLEGLAFSDAAQGT